MAAERGHRVTLFDAADEIGGQFNRQACARQREFHETIRYYSVMLDKLGVDLKLGQRVSADDRRRWVSITGSQPVSPRVCLN